jgi:hypothetical protein
MTTTFYTAECVALALILGTLVSLITLVIFGV